MMLKNFLQEKVSAWQIPKKIPPPFWLMTPRKIFCRQNLPPAGKIKAGNQRQDQLDKAAGSASDLKIFRRYFHGGCKNSCSAVQNRVTSESS